MRYYEKLRSKKGNVRLCSISLLDADKYCEWKNRTDEESRIVFESYKDEKVLDIQDAEKILNDLATDDAFAIINDNQLIGLIGYSRMKLCNQRTNVWIQMDPYLDMDKQVFFGEEALDALIRYSYDSMNLHNIMMQVPAFNIQALEILRNSNMQYLGSSVATALYQNDLYYSTVYYQTTKERYLENYKHIEKIDKSCRRIMIPDDSKLSELVQGEKISLVKCKNPTDKQVSRCAEILNNPKVGIPFGWHKVNWNDYRARKYLSNSEYLVLKEEELVGCVNLFRKDVRSHNAELEIMIGEQYQKKGYGREALTLLLQDAFENGGYVSLLSSIFSFNDKSQKLHEAMGYHKFGSRMESYYAYGEFHDIEMYEMPRDSYFKKYHK